MSHLLTAQERAELLDEYAASTMFARECASNMSVDRRPPPELCRAVIDAYGPETLADADHEAFLIMRPWRAKEPVMLAEVITMRRHPSNGNVS